MKHAMIGAGLLGLLALGGIWLVVHEDQPVDAGAKAAVDPVARKGAAKKVLGGERTSLAEVATRVEIHVEDGRGHPLPGSARWRFLHGPRLVGSSLRPQVVNGSEPVVVDGERSKHAGRLEIEIPPQALLWIYLVSELDGQTREHYELIDPVVSSETVTIPMNRLGGEIHVFLLDEKLMGNLPGAFVGLYYAPLDGSKPPSGYRSVRADSHGYARFNRAQDGVYFVMAPGSEKGDMPPYTERVILGGGQGQQEAAVVVRAKAKRPWVELTVDSRLPLRPGQPSVLFARRTDGEHPELIPLKGNLEPGKRSLKLRLPDGSFELAVLPEGVGLVEPARFTVVRGQAEPASFGIEGNPARCEVELVDFNKPDLPAKVWYRPEGRRLDENRRLLYTGPLTWRIPKMAVPLPASRGRFVVWNKVHYWISKQTFEPGATSLRVELLPATRLQVRWSGAAALTNRSLYLSIQSDGNRLERVFEKTLVPNGQSRDFIRLGTAVLPRGQVQVEALESETQRVLWTRTLTLAKDYETLEVTGSG